MPHSQAQEQYQARTRYQSNYLQAQAEHPASEELSGAPDSGMLHPALLHDHKLTMRGNEPVRATLMNSAQQTHGNRAVQRAIHARPGSPPASLRPVQRSFLSSALDAGRHIPGRVGNMAATFGRGAEAGVSFAIHEKNQAAERGQEKAEEAREMADEMQGEISQEAGIIEMIMESKNETIEAIIAMLNAAHQTKLKLGTAMRP